MKSNLYRLLSAALLTAFVASCGRNEKDIPAPMTRTASSDFSYIYYPTPEPVVYATATTVLSGPNRSYNVPYVLGASQIAGGHPIYAFTPNLNNDSGLPGSWQTVAGPNGGGVVKMVTAIYTEYTGTRFRYIVAITEQNELWITQYGGIYPSNPSPTPRWINTHQLATDVAVTYNQPGTPIVFFLGVENIAGGHPVYQLNSSPQILDGPTYSKTENVPGAAGVGITFDVYARPWLVTSGQQIWVGPQLATGGTYRQILGQGVGISSSGYDVVVLGTAFQSTGYQVYKRDVRDNLDTYTWLNQSGELTQIGTEAGSGPRGRYFGVSSDGFLFKTD